MSDRTALFTKISQGRKAKGLESVSGEGSSLAYTQDLRLALNHFLKAQDITSMLDIPCGDFNWMSHVNLTGISYLGMDIVPWIIQQNQQQYPDRNFRVRDLLTDTLPSADLLFCRDCLMHFSFEDVVTALINLSKSSSKWILLTTHPGRKNHDISTGLWFPINLEAAPFNLPAPALRIPDGDGRILGLWRPVDLV